MRCAIALCLYMLSVVGGRRVNYCGARMCGGTDAHTFCQFMSGPALSCTGYIDAPLSKEEKSRLLARINRRRNEAASGKLQRLPSAGDMLKLRWIEELSKEAQLWANQCSPPPSPGNVEERDECRDLYSISVGQCIASVVGEAPGLRVESMVDMWYMQWPLYNGNVSTYVPSENHRHYSGDFVQMLWSKSFMVGCGRSRFMISSQGRHRSVERLVCNFSPAGPAPLRAVWAAAEPATLCPPRSHPDKALPALCNYQFEMDESDLQDNTMAIEQHVLLNSVLETERNDSLHNIGSLDELYLTNLAIVTMDVETSTAFNSIQKRDVNETVAANNNVNLRDKKESRTALKSSDYQNTKINKKYSIIGRPKTYNIAELTEIGDDPKDNHEKKAVPKNFNDIYGDYIVDIEEESETSETSKTLQIERDTVKNKITDTVLASTTKMIPDNINIDENIPTQQDVEFIATTTYSTTSTFDLNINNAIIDMNETIKDIPEDYLTDPETVRELQKALDQMERSQMKTTKTSTKVRRELHSNDMLSSSAPETLPEEPKNATVDNSPVMSMVFKYMPYLKEYENEILSRGNSAFCVSYGVFSHITVFLTLCLSIF